MYYTEVLKRLLQKHKNLQQSLFRVSYTDRTIKQPKETNINQSHAPDASGWLRFSVFDFRILGRFKNSAAMRAAKCGFPVSRCCT